MADRSDQLAAVTTAEVGSLTQVSLRLDPALAARAPLALPATPNTWTASDGHEALWLGPDEWLVVTWRDAAEVVAWLEGALDGVHHSVVDVSAGRMVVELAGERRAELLAHGCALDLHPRAWRAGMCAQTLVARVPVLLQERDAATRVFVRPSYAAHLAAWLGATSGQPASP